MKDLKIFTQNIEQQAIDQINLLLEQEAFKDCKVRIMPDVHSGAGCVIGFTANLGEKIIPNVVGVDIGCGMTWFNTKLKEINLKEFDEFIRREIPSGMNVNQIEYTVPIDIEELYCYNKLKNRDRYLQKSMCSLGGGNHFIEIDKAENGDLYIVIHSGSRNLGKQVCDYYQNKAIDNLSFKEEKRAEKEQIIKTLKECGREQEIGSTLKKIDLKYENRTKLPKDLCYLEGKDREDYLHDMKICQDWASFNRYFILMKLLNFLKMELKNINPTQFRETIHNYIDDENIVRKGAISSKKDEFVLIPINMRDGCIIAKGKGNPDWNYSAPHGAGRIMSRGEARRTLNVNDFKETMQGIYSTSICEDTLDEAPMVYKNINEIITNIKDTAEIIEIIKPIYNFKAKE